MAGQETTYTLKKEYTYPNARIRVFVPDLTEEERNRRYERLKKSTAQFMMAVEKELKEKGA